jgi:protein-tyrosine phosphatase
MKYGFVLLLLGMVLAAEAFVHHGAAWLLLWPAVSFLVVAVAYLGLGPAVFGKRPRGRLAWHSTMLLLPFHLFSWAIWHFLRLTSREDCCNEVMPGLIVGRRPLAHEVPDHVSLVIDLTAEFNEPAAVRAGREYIAAPVLDGGMPSEALFLQTTEAALKSPGVVYLHCAQGHGRTGIIAAAVMIASGHSPNVEEAIRALCSARPKLNLAGNQMRFLKNVCQRERFLQLCGCEREAGQSERV